MGTLPVVDGRAPIHIFASSKSWIEGEATRQLELVASLTGVTSVAAMPDLHPGKYGPVGCAILSDRIHPELVGSDIGCGMALYQLDANLRKLRPDDLADRLRVLDEPNEDAEAAIAAADLAPSLFDAALGSIGGGNHFCEVQAIEDILAPDVAQHHGLQPEHAFVLVHSGSRGLGSSILERMLAGGQEALHLSSTSGGAYLADHDHAVAWARINRDLIARRAAVAARADARLIADLPHNMVEVVGQPGGGCAALHRKGAAASDRGLVPVPGSRGSLSYLVEPLPHASPHALSSIAHGAGRKHDRASMHGRIRGSKSEIAGLKRNPFHGFVVCEDRDLLIEEAPQAYKNIERVIEDLETFGLVRVVATFRPIITYKKGVAQRARMRRDRTRREDRR